MNTPSKNTVASSSNSKDEAIIIYQQLKMQFHGTIKGDLETIDSYIKKLKSIADSLTEIGNPISDPDLVLQLLAGLTHPRYSLLKNRISSQLPLPNFSEACSMLYEYEKTTSTPPLTGENSNSNTGKSTLEMIHDIENTVASVVPIASKICSALIRWWSVSGSSGPPTKATPGPGNTKKGSTGGRGRGNNNKGRGRGGGGGGGGGGGRGGGRGRGGSSTRNSTGK